ncbi:MAG: hypothetical protein ACM3SY_22140 [Candidatus Omnitrophota bacterium]
MKKNNAIIICLCIVGVFVFLFPSCRTVTKHRLEVKLEIPSPLGADLNPYKTIIYKDLVPESVPQGFDPVPLLRSFFLNDFAKAVDKKVELWNNQTYGEGKVPSDAVILSGTFKLDVKDRSKIEENKDQNGKKKREFVNVQHWSMGMSIRLTDSNGKELFNQSYDEKLSDADPANLKINFDNLFFRISNVLINRLNRRQRMETRYLLF